MVVELLDYRAQKFNQPLPEKPERTRVTLHPNPETLYADICTMNQKSGGMWSDKDALEVESKLLVSCIRRPQLSVAERSASLPPRLRCVSIQIHILPGSRITSYAHPRPPFLCH
jgi:hypothetical protein